MKKDKFVIGYEIFSAMEDNNYNGHYRYAIDEEGILYQCHYGHIGDGKWYISCFEDVESGHKTDFIKGKLTYYVKSGRLPFQYIEGFSWDDVRGLSLDFTEFNGRQTPCFIRWNENKCYIIND